MNDVAPLPRSRSIRIPLWDDHTHAERFAALLALAAMMAGLPYAVTGRVALARICVALGIAELALCAACARGAPRWVLGVGTPAAMTLCALVLLFTTGGRSIVAVVLLALAPAVGGLWGPPRSDWSFLALAVVGSFFALAFAGGVNIGGGDPWLSHVRASWAGAPLSLGAFWLAHSWRKAHGDYSEDVAATHAVLAASEARFRAYVENAHDVTVEVDARGRLLFVSRSHEKHYAAPIAELLGSRGGELLHPDDLVAARAVFVEAAAGRSRVSPPLRYRGAGEGWRWLRVAVNSYRAADGSLRFVVHARDETQRQESDAARERRIRELETALARAGGSAEESV